MKNLPKFILLFFITAAVVSCKTLQDVTVDGQTYRLESPPGMTQIGENMFMDEVLITNSDYLFFIFWDYQTRHPEDTIDYFDYPSDTSYYIKRDGMFSIEIDRYGTYKTEKYRGHPAYQNHPLVGISIEDARRYTKWRQDRIIEATLINKGLIDVEYNEKTTITLEDVINKKVPFKPSKLKHIALPVLSLPSNEQMLWGKRDTISQYFVSKRSKSRIMDSYGYLFLLDRYYKEMISLDFRPGCIINNYGILNLGELVNEYVQTEQGTNNPTIIYDGVGFSQWTGDEYCATGFRNVAHYIIIDLRSE